MMRLLNLTERQHSPKRVSIRRICTLGRRRLLVAWLAIGITVAGTSWSSAADPDAAFDVQIDQGRVYSILGDLELKCDVYQPARGIDATEEKRPVVVLIHGGAWTSGSRRTMSGFAMRLARGGIVAVTIDYRLAPRWKFPAQVDDVRQAMNWVNEQADQLGVDPLRMGLFGYSAGGHLACMIGTLVDETLATQATASCWAADDPRFTQLIKPLAICAGSPPCDLTQIPASSGGLAYFLGGTPAELPEAYLAASPLTHASAGDSPTLFIHGNKDAIVPIRNSRSLFTAQRAAGVDSEYVTIDNQGHLLTFINPQTSDAMIRFFQSRLTGPFDEPVNLDNQQPLGGE